MKLEPGEHLLSSRCQCFFLHCTGSRVVERLARARESLFARDRLQG